MELQIVLSKFARLLGERIELGEPITEDTIWYTFYFALTTSGGLRWRPEWRMHLIKFGVRWNLDARKPIS